MSLDGAFLHCIKDELIDKGLIGGRVDKIHQPSKEEIIVSLRSSGGNEKLLFSANPVSARVNLTEIALENPKQPPMFCMLLRKHLGGGKLINISQDGLERILNLDFECMNEIGDMVTNRLIIEIMGRCSNIILTTQKDGVYRVIDSIKRVTDDVSSVRRVLPNVIYELPPRDSRLNFLTCTDEEIISAISCAKDERIAKLLLKVFEGISPVFARECAFYACCDVDKSKNDITPEIMDKIIFFMKRARKAIADKNSFTIVSELSGKPKDFCFINIEQYSTEMLISKAESANKLLDKFFSIKSQGDRMKQRSSDLLKMLMNTYERISRKIELQKQELITCGDREVFRVWGDLVNSNLYRIEKGQNEVLVDNFYTGEKETIKLDVRLTPSQNAQKYYSEYKKLDTAEKMLTKLIEQGKQELIYVDSVFDAVSRTTGESELLEIRQELVEQGYLRQNKKANKMLKAQPPMKFRSSDGFEIYVGRNNIQNDKLTLKTAKGDDLWFHTQNIAGSHTVVFSQGKEIPDSTIVEAATLAAFCSKARASTKVAVDYTKIKFVKKPNGAKPGMVIFTNNKTILVDPDEQLYERILVK